MSDHIEDRTPLADTAQPSTSKKRRREKHTDARVEGEDNDAEQATSKKNKKRRKSARGSSSKGKDIADPDGPPEPITPFPLRIRAEYLTPQNLNYNIDGLTPFDMAINLSKVFSWNMESFHLHRADFLEWQQLRRLTLQDVDQSLRCAETMSGGRSSAEQEAVPTLYARAVVTFGELMDMVESVEMKDELAKRVIDYILHFKLQYNRKGALDLYVPDHQEIFEKAKAQLTKPLAGDQPPPESCHQNTTLPTANGSGPAKDALASVIESLKWNKQPGTTRSELIGNEEAVDIFERAVIVPTKATHLKNFERVNCGGILLFGPPGTGKSLLCQMVADRCNVTVFEISDASVKSKWQGDSEKFVEAIFDAAASSSPAIIFIDEIDGLLATRSDHDASDTARSIKVSFLRAWSKYSDAQAGPQVTVVGTTNCPWAIDPGFHRRFDHEVFMDIPTIAELTRIIRIRVNTKPHNLTEDDFMSLATTFHGMTGSDVESAWRGLKQIMLQKHVMATTLKPTVINGESYYIACPEDDPDAVKKEDIHTNLHQYTPLEKEDVRSALAKKGIANTNHIRDLHMNWAARKGKIGY